MGHIGWSALTPLLTGATLSIVFAVGARSRHKRTQDADVFEFPPFLGYLIAGCGIFFLCAGFLPGAEGNVSKTIFFWEMSPFWIGSFGAAIWFLRYRVTLTQQCISIRSLGQSSIALSDIVDTDLLDGRNPQLVLYIRDGRRIRFSGMLQDFYELSSMISDKVNQSGAAPKDSPEKLADHARIAAGNRHALWLMLVGAILVIALLIALHMLNP